MNDEIHKASDSCDGDRTLGQSQISRDGHGVKAQVLVSPPTKERPILPTTSEIRIFRWWLIARLHYVHCWHTGDTAVLHCPFDSLYEFNNVGSNSRTITKRRSNMTNRYILTYFAKIEPTELFQECFYMTNAVPHLFKTSESWKINFDMPYYMKF